MKMKNPYMHKNGYGDMAFNEQKSETLRLPFESNL